MMSRYPLLRSLDPHHARIGYLGTLASVATRGLDTPDALAARFHDLLFEKIFPDDPRFTDLLARVPAERRPDLEKRKFRPVDEDPVAAFTEPYTPEAGDFPPDWPLSVSRRRPLPRLVKTEWFYVSELWLYDGAMPSSVGHLGREKLGRTIDLARWTSVLLPTFELSETGFLLQHLLAAGRIEQGLNGSMFNPLNPRAHECLPLLYFHVILASDMLYPFLILELVAQLDNSEKLTTRGPNGLLLRAVKRLLMAISDIADPEDAIAVREVERFREAIEGKYRTQENYLRPRLEMLVDIGFLNRRGGSEGKRSEFVWEVTDTTRMLAGEIAGLTSPRKTVSEDLEHFLDRRFFSSMALVRGRQHARVASEDERLLWFARAFQKIGREFGFTPGRTLALKACLMSWQQRRTMEVGEVFDAVYAAARSPFDHHLHFSGGSRFDREFLIRLDDDIIPVLEQRLALA